MKILKKSVWSIALIGISTCGFAGAPGNAVVSPAGLPLLALESQSFWTLGIEDLYVKSTSPHYQYAQIDENTTPDTINNQTVDPNYHNAFELDATYHFAGSDRDITVAYMHADMEDSDNSQIFGNETFEDPFDLIPTRRDHVDKIRGETDNLYNGTDLVFGQHMQVGQVLDLHPFGGIRYADLNSRENSTYSNDEADDNTIQATAQMSSHYEGLGPRAGIDATVFLTPAFSIVGTLGGSLELGYDDANVTTQTTGNLPVEVELDNDWYVVPELDAKLGVSYRHCFNPQTSMEVEVGWQVVNYFSAIEDDSQDIFLQNSQINRQNFGFEGAYARLALNLA